MAHVALRFKAQNVDDECVLDKVRKSLVSRWRGEESKGLVM